MCAPLMSMAGFDPIRRRACYARDSALALTATAYGIALKGNGSNAGLQLTRSSGVGFEDIVPAASEITVMALVRVNSLGTRRIFFADSDSAGLTNRIILEQQAANNYRLRIINGGGTAVTVTGGTATTGWHWIEITHDGVNLEGFLDGVSLGTAACSLPRGKNAGGAASSARFLRNGDGTTLASDFDGQCLFVWSRVLSSVERRKVRQNPWQVYSAADDLYQSILVTAAAGGTTYTKIVSESATIVDQLLAYSFRVRSGSDSVTASDSIGPAILRGRVASDSISVTDAFVRFVRWVRSVDEGVTISEALQKYLRFRRTTDEYAEIIDALVKVVVGQNISVVVMSDVAVVTDSIGQVLRRVRTSDDAIIVSDVLSDYLRRVRGVFESLEISDGTVRVVWSVKFISEVLGISESLAYNIYRYVQYTYSPLLRIGSQEYLQLGSDDFVFIGFDSPLKIGGIH